MSIRPDEEKVFGSDLEARDFTIEEGRARPTIVPEPPQTQEENQDKGPDDGDRLG